MNEEITKQTKTKKVGLDILLCKHCNLRCRACARFSNVAKPYFYDFSMLKSDLKKIKDTLTVERFTFTGGEPLLHPQLENILVYTRELYPEIGISIFTNGKALIEKNIWDLLKKLDIGITYTKYINSNVDYDAIESMATANGIAFHNICLYNNKSCPELKSKMYLFKLSKHIKDDLNTKKQMCDGDCPCLWESKIFQCGTVAFIDTLNSVFKTNFYHCKGDYLEVNSLTSDKYFNYITKPIPFCRYCMNCKVDEIEWSQAKSTIDDYVER